MDAAFGTCRPCGDTCATCDSGDKCKTCPERYLLGATKCIQCLANEYIEGDSCVKCGVNCALCDSGPNQCKVCAAGSELQPDGTCKCQKGRFLDESTGRCELCHSSCETCFSQDKCATCPTGFTLADTICLNCASNEYVSRDQCLNCGEGCLACESGPNQCKQCVVNAGLRNDGVCECLTGYFYDAVTN